MPTSRRSRKLIVAMNTHKAMSLQNLSKILGIPFSTYELNSIVNQFETKGIVENVQISPKGTFANLTEMGMKLSADILENR
ncbi:hypothetical protein [Flammeovirga sp. OC4]|uniref:hypothetical protein n=1 Tax=Flammeovirga sp. OC4 TaxID=1382345 RepID=UPI0005C69C46|nr:hypothetical protein [Flammeovirga sp. OC4]